MYFQRQAQALGVLGTLLGGGYAQVGAPITLDVTSADSIKAAAGTAAYNMMKVYTGNQTGQIPGLLPQPYYWWEAGAMLGQLIHYWFLTGDSSYNDVVTQGIQFQVGANNDFMPQNQTKDLGNDDQVFWAFTAMDAAELGFPNPPSSDPSWLSLAQAVFNDQVLRWDTAACGGGLRWQIYPFNAGYDYKNTVANGGFFQLAARLARYTGNQTYADWAEKTYDWIASTPILAANYQVWDGTSRTDNCSGAVETYWTYNLGTLISGCAYMYNFTEGNSTWGTRLSGLVNNGSSVFFVQSAGLNNPSEQAPPNGLIMSEVACEFPTPQTCDPDEPSFKAHFGRWLAVTTQLAPWTAPFIMPRLTASAQAAAAQCTGQATNMCGRRWYQTVWDGYFGVGEQMSALSIFQNLLIEKVAAPVTAAKGGTSVGNPSAGGAGDNQQPSSGQMALGRVVGTGDKAGAGILTALSLILIIAATWWMIV
ncbi:hydrolase 76 protein [Xylographa bjoerkii]|nr:hydrolase 76 protein [Xylographa bjoerkii]